MALAKSWRSSIAARTPARRWRRCGAGWARVVFTGRTDVLEKLTDIAAQQGAQLVRPDPQATALDLLDAADPLAACRNFLAAENT